jgi:hypothetical protein
MVFVSFVGFPVVSHFLFFFGFPFRFPVLFAFFSPVIDGRELLAMDSNGLSDPFVRISLKGKEVFKSKTISKTLNPDWNEEASMSVHLYLLSYDSSSFFVSTLSLSVCLFAQRH